MDAAAGDREARPYPIRLGTGLYLHIALITLQLAGTKSGSSTAAA